MDDISNLWAVKNPTKWDFEFDSNNSDPNSRPISMKSGMTRLLPMGLAKWVGERIVDEIIKRDYKIELTIDQSFRNTIRPQVILGESSGYIEDIKVDAKVAEANAKMKEVKEIKEGMETGGFNYETITYKQLQKLAGEKKINPLQKREDLIEALKNS